jgi:hypothetical protein
MGEKASRDKKGVYVMYLIEGNSTDQLSGRK